MPPKKNTATSTRSVTKKPKDLAVVYTLHGCPWCAKAKTHLKERGYKIKEHKIHHGDEQLPLPDGRTSGYTYPQVFIMCFIGGYEQLTKTHK